jgi:GAF domain-containing protein
VTAAGLADVGAADPHPAVVARRLDQGAEKFAVGGLGGGPRGERRAGLAGALGERVAQALELAEVEQARGRAGCDDRVEDGDTPEAVEGEVGELELEAADLAAQLGAREALVAVDAKRRLDRLSCQHSGHLPSQV